MWLRSASGLLFPGQYFDEESGLYYNYYRYYDPSTGRYPTTDPIGITYDFSNPHLQLAINHGIPLNAGDGSLGLNHLYGYAEQNPINKTDPLGLSPIPGFMNGMNVSAEVAKQDANNAMNKAKKCFADCVAKEALVCFQPTRPKVGVFDIAVGGVCTLIAEYTCSTKTCDPCEQ